MSDHSNDNTEETIISYSMKPLSKMGKYFSIGKISFIVSLTSRRYRTIEFCEKMI